MRSCLRLAVLCGFAFLLGSVASADDIHVTLDPETPASAGVYDLIQAQGTAYSVEWVSCQSSPMFAVAGLGNDTGCLAFVNISNAPIAALDLTFTDVAGMDGQTVMCDNLDGYLTSNNCASVAPNGIVNGDTYSINLYGGTAIGNQMAFYLGETGVSIADLNQDMWSVDVPEPGTLVLLLVGLGALFAFGFRKQQALHTC
jgi:PEP-CTERM motif